MEAEIVIPNCFKCRKRADPGYVHVCYQKNDLTFRTGQMGLYCKSCWNRLRGLNWNTERLNSFMRCRHCHGVAAVIETDNLKLRQEEAGTSLMYSPQFTGEVDPDISIRDAFFE